MSAGSGTSVGPPLRQPPRNALMPAHLCRRECERASERRAFNNRGADIKRRWLPPCTQQRPRPHLSHRSGSVGSAATTRCPCTCSCCGSRGCSSDGGRHRAAPADPTASSAAAALSSVERPGAPPAPAALVLSCLQTARGGWRGGRRRAVVWQPTGRCRRRRRTAAGASGAQGCRGGAPRAAPTWPSPAQQGAGPWRPWRRALVPPSPPPRSLRPCWLLRGTLGDRGVAPGVSICRVEGPRPFSTAPPAASAARPNAPCLGPPPQTQRRVTMLRQAGKAFGRLARAEGPALVSGSCLTRWPGQAALHRC